MSLLTKIFGTKSGREIKKIQPLVKEINALYDSFEEKDESYLFKRTRELQEIVKEKIKTAEDKQIVDLTDRKEIQRVRKTIEKEVLDKKIDWAVKSIRSGEQILKQLLHS